MTVAVLRYCKSAGNHDAEGELPKAMRSEPKKEFRL